MTNFVRSERRKYGNFQFTDGGGSFPSGSRACHSVVRNTRAGRGATERDKGVLLLVTVVDIVSETAALALVF